MQMTNIVVASMQDLEAILDKKIQPLVAEVEKLRASVSALVDNKPKIMRSEAARMLGITQKQVVSISFQKGTIPVNKRHALAYETVGGRYMYDTNDVLAYKNKASLPDNPSR
jgi:hypothetical protein